MCIASLWNKKARLWVLGRKNFPEGNFTHKTIWMHCASLGEFEQGRPLLEALRKNFPDYPVVLSFFSPSGYEIRKNYPGADKIIYLPLDTKENAFRLISSINPAIVLWVKYEYWFNFLWEIHNRKIPLLLVSGIFRKNQPFFKWYGNFWRNGLSFFSHFFVQNEHSRLLLHKIDIKNNVTVAGDTRFDRVIDIAEKNEELPLVKSFIHQQQVLIAGSTWQKDEMLIQEYASKHPEIKIIIAPHEIHQTNLERIKKTFPCAVFYSDFANEEANKSKQILIMDNIGMLSRIYKHADITYVGGGFEKSGIHNTLEAAVYGKPVIFGPNYQKFNEAKELINENAAFSINNAIELENMLTGFFDDKNKLSQAGENARKTVYNNRGATVKIINYIKENRLLTI